MTRLTLDDVYEHISGVCFKTGPPGQVGAETEWFVADRQVPERRVTIGRLRTVMETAGPPPAGSRITYEPGGQLELSSLPQRGVVTAQAALAADIAHVGQHLARDGLALEGRGADPRNLRDPFFQLDEGRYRCMREYFGEAGLAMMCATASLQVCLDIGADDKDATRRWRLAHALGPVLVAAFANSPWNGSRSVRQVIWEGLDRGRTAPVVGDDPVAAWAKYALDARVMLLRQGWVPNPGMTFREWLADGRPDADDLAYHLTTLFPPVRPQGWLELRMIDALPEPYWPVPIAVVTALIEDPVAADIAAEAAEPVADRWCEAARDALTDPALARAARRCFEAALDALPRLGAEALVPLVTDYADRFVARGRCPADERPLDEDAGTRVPAGKEE
ncbi:ergothioneine biosynthesis glutamate--cysteine ligase EgtA [Actinomadura sp. DC4]|uniref:ergothioneine biosynthesis glutamate--cysteine ligase EgtA n=1 Tax=Actinomadura sp. DC4 TaxID=3055069 RepID=UPI0025AF1988|nr:ergothioneine biosynthesis glutamate--cysteine ligase EgtA [Actinomadura sp. DC4]MDN3356934.1 ergothioneine biosynthesis glutamate--cysteine ligase EgtA [Actinomadura sp. DC4]